MSGKFKFHFFFGLIFNASFFFFIIKYFWSVVCWICRCETDINIFCEAPTVEPRLLCYPRKWRNLNEFFLLHRHLCFCLNQIYCCAICRQYKAKKINFDQRGFIYWKNVIQIYFLSSFENSSQVWRFRSSLGALLRWFCARVKLCLVKHDYADRRNERKKME